MNAKTRICNSTVTYCRKAFGAPHLSVGVVAAVFSGSKMAKSAFLLLLHAFFLRSFLLLHCYNCCAILAERLTTIGFEWCNST